MGRIVKHEIAGFTCELRSCPEKVMSARGLPATSTWHDQLLDLENLIEAGWALVLHSQLRSYCAEHADRAWDCTCRTHPTRAVLCTSHNAESPGLVWTSISTPTLVTEFRKVMA